MIQKSAACYLVLNCCFVSLGLAQVPRFLEPPFFSTGATVVSSLITADFNNDGIPDVATADQQYGNIISVLIAHGDGTFAPANTYNAGSGPQRFAAGDLNGDGNLDLIVPDFGLDLGSSKVISILLGNGDGTFQPKTQVTVGSHPTSAAVGDFNRDGKLDVVVSNSSSNSVSLLSGNGDGSFQPAVTIPVGKDPDRVLVADFNGDGKLDLAVAAQGSRSLEILLGNGDGTFQNEQDHFITQSPLDLVVADFNGDGKPDLAALSYVDLIVLLGNGDGTFQSEIDTAETMFPEGFIAADLDGDGRVDLLVSDQALSVFSGNGDGTFQPPVHYAFGGTGATVGEFDANPGLDVVAATPLNAGNPGFYLLSNNGDGALQAPQSFIAPINITSSTGKDLNGDGKPDLVVTSAFSSTTNSVSTFLNDGEGKLVSRADYATGKNPVSVAVQDTNGDGVDDLAVANQLDSTVSILLGNGDGTFQSRHDYPTGASPESIVVGDFNGDGLNDLATTDNASSGKVSILLNVAGAFPTHTEVPAAAYPWTIVAQDLNKDGNLDLVVSYKNLPIGGAAQVISVFLGNGDGTFQPRVDYPTGGTVYNAVVGVADVNGDGIKDLVAARDDFFVETFLGNGDGTFQPHLDSPSQFSANNIELRDIDGDGRTDLIASSVGVYMLGNGDGTFQSQVVFLPQPLSSVTVADYNGDGALDVVACQASEGVLTLVPNTGGSKVALTSSENPSHVGEKVTFTGRVTPTFNVAQPTGMMSFYADNTLLGRVPLSHGRAKFSTSALTAGAHRIQAIYSGDTVFVPHDSNPKKQVVTAQRQLAPTFRSILFSETTMADQRGEFR